MSGVKKELGLGHWVAICGKMLTLTIRCSGWHLVYPQGVSVAGLEVGLDWVEAEGGSNAFTKSLDFSLVFFSVVVRIGQIFDSSQLNHW